VNKAGCVAGLQRSVITDQTRCYFNGYGRFRKASSTLQHPMVFHFTVIFGRTTLSRFIALKKCFIFREKAGGCLNEMELAEWSEFTRSEKWNTF
jgi:hypothetical protein